MRITETFEHEVAQPETIDLIELLSNFQNQYRNVFMIQLEGTVFIYRSLGRAEYKKLLMEEDLTDYEKQDVICEVCVLYPENFDFDNCSAGLPDVLHRKIIENSFLDSVESRKSVLTYYRNEMFALENQIACIINEAFPNLDIETIEQWDTEQTMKYLSRAEWKLKNLRGVPFVDSSEVYESFYPAPPAEEAQEATPVQPTQAAPEENRRGGGKEKMTPEKLEELREFQRKFPEFANKGETILTEGIGGMSDSFDSVTPGLRPGV